jgi:chaperonin GroES
MNLTPLGDCILLKQNVEKSGLILLPQSKMFSGVIMAAGKKTTDVAVGDNVLFGEHSGQKVTHEGEDYLMMREKDVIGIFNE